MEGRFHGRPVRAKDLAERLLPELNLNEVLLWPPDLFAYTSYVLTVTSAYQLVVSPPSGKRWQPPKEELVTWLHDGAATNLREWLRATKSAWGLDDVSFDFKEHLSAIRQWREGSGKYNNAGFEQLETKGQPKDASRVLEDWEHLARVSGSAWRTRLDASNEHEFVQLLFRRIEPEPFTDEAHEAERRRHRKLLETILENTPPLLLACWAFFYNETVNDKSQQGGLPRLGDLLCNQDHLQGDTDYCDRLWRIFQALLTLHAISDLASLEFGIRADPSRSSALLLAEKLLFGKYKIEGSMNLGGSLSTFNVERCRVLPKRHNPDIGITLRSISSNLAFHQSAVDVVWRKTRRNALGEKLIRDNEDARLSILLLPFPLVIKAKDFGEDTTQKGQVVSMSPTEYSFFAYEPYPRQSKPQRRKAQELAIEKQINRALDLIAAASDELSDDFDIDLVVLPEAALCLTEFAKLEEGLRTRFGKVAPSIIIAGVRESKDELAQEMTRLGMRRSSKDFNFPRNAVYCKYYDKKGEIKNGRRIGSYYNRPDPQPDALTPKYKQYKHHRWQLDKTQVRRYGLSSILKPNLTWWESIKIPKRRVSFLNVGDRMTISHLICEDLARQDPIAELVRQVGPTLVVTILMDGPQLKNRWSARYATVLSDDPGSSVITLTSLGMVKRHSSEFGAMSRVIALWNESGAGHSREIELAPGAEAILLTLRMDETPEKTADGRKEAVATSILRLNDVIQIYPNASKKQSKTKR